MTHLHVLQHDANEGPGILADWAARRGLPLTTTRLDRSEPLPQPAALDGLLVMGGPMNIYQDRDYPWLRAERALIRAHVAAGKPAIGICLGSQFLADALGGRVTQNPLVEIGWFPVAFTPEARARFPHLPATLDVVHWHGDTFELPPGATRLATSQACANQGFLHGDRVLALQFHPEMTRDLATALVQEAGPGLPTNADAAHPLAPFVQSGNAILARPDAAFAATHALLTGLLDEIFPPAKR